MDKKILIVEDEEQILRQYSQLLSEFGDILEAKNSRDAFVLLEKYSFDLLILDNCLIADPNFSQNKAGFYLLKHVRKVLELDSPAILITGLDKMVDNIDVEAKVSDLESCWFMEKPADLNVLKGKVEEILCPSGRSIEINEINNESLWDWMNEKEQLKMKNYSSMKPGKDEYFSVINKLAEKYIICPGDTVFKNLIKNSKYLDWILYLTEKRYRNHFEHQFNVGAFGWYLLDVEVETGMTLREKILDISEHRETGWTREQLDSSWWIASLLHDHAYPIAYLFEAAFPMRIFFADESNIYKNQMGNILNAYNEIYSSVLAPKLNSLFVRSWKSDVKNELIEEIAHNLLRLQMNENKMDLKKPDPYDHGILGAANIVSLLRREGYNQIDPVINEALKAIAFHNNEKISNIWMDENPIAFLLILCDQLQDWNRVIIKNDECLIEFDNISLNLNNLGGEKLQFPERLRVRFEYKREEVLKQTGWNYDLFLKSKREHIGRLGFPKFFNPKGLDIEVLVLHQLDSCKNPV